MHRFKPPTLSHGVNSIPRSARETSPAEFLGKNRLRAAHHEAFFPGDAVENEPAVFRRPVERDFTAAERIVAGLHVNPRFAVVAQHRRAWHDDTIQWFSGSSQVR